MVDSSQKDIIVEVLLSSLGTSPEICILIVI